MSWIHRRDLLRLIELLSEREELAGVFNATAPTPVTGRQFAHTLGRVLHRPAILPIPALVLRIAFGEMSRLLLTGQRVFPVRAEAAGFEFEFRDRVEADWLPALDAHRPQMILVSAGFDAHARDPLGGLELHEADFRWVTELIVDVAARHAAGRIVSVLEGGYDLDALARSVDVHVQVLREADGN